MQLTLLGFLPKTFRISETLYSKVKISLFLIWIYIL